MALVKSERITSPHIAGPFSSVHVLGDIVPKLDCGRLVAAAKAHAAQHGWQTQRHAFHATQDLSIASIDGISDWFDHWSHTVALPQLSNLFHVSRLTISDAFIIRYSLDCQPGLELHSDGSPLSFIVALNELDEYEGGGTFVRALEHTFRLGCGAGFFFSGKWKHAGAPIHTGERFVLAAFVKAADPGPAPQQIEALEAETTLADDNTDVAAWQELSHARRKQGRPSEALAAHEAAVAANPSSSVGWYHYANHLGDECDDLPKALDAYRRAASLDGSLWLQVAYCEIRLADSEEGYQKALAAFQQAADTGSAPLTDVSLGIADVMCVLDRHAEALPYYATVLRTDPEDAVAWRAQGSAQLALMDEAAAVCSFRQACQYQPDAGLLRQLAMLLQSRGEHEEARKCFREACAIEESGSDATSDDSSDDNG